MVTFWFGLLARGFDGLCGFDLVLWPRRCVLVCLVGCACGSAWFPGILLLEL